MVRVLELQFRGCAFWHSGHNFVLTKEHWCSVQGGHKPKKPGILRDFSEFHMENSGNSVQPQGKIVTNKNTSSSSFKYLCKTAVDWVNRIILLELTWNDPWWRSLLHLLFVAITYGKVSLGLWKSLENSGDFFLLHCGHPAVYGTTLLWYGKVSVGIAESGSSLPSDWCSSNPWADCLETEVYSPRPQCS